MGKRVLLVDAMFLRELFAQGRVIGDTDRIARVTQGIPSGAKIVSCWVNQERAPRCEIAILLEHESWSETPDGEPYQPLAVLCVTVPREET